ncbi:DUF5994 family protein [Streptomyces sp. NPDC051597]|uniref:DUF5994 family protein n=1 Tax=Streptomyces sp. NPDC051597 TaxID=3155049 RepID=UPI00344343B5
MHISDYPVRSRGCVHALPGGVGGDRAEVDSLRRASRRRGFRCSRQGRDVGRLPDGPPDVGVSRYFTGAKQGPEPLSQLVRRGHDSPWKGARSAAVSLPTDGGHTMKESDTPRAAGFPPEAFHRAAKPWTVLLRLATTQTGEDRLAGAWWPRSRRFGVELPDVVHVVTGHLGPITRRIGLDAGAWEGFRPVRADHVTQANQTGISHTRRRPVCEMPSVLSTLLRARPWCGAVVA